jgi:hypothetical protein
MAGTYSKSNTGSWKRSLDAEIAKSHVQIDFHNEDYLKQLVRLCNDSQAWVDNNAGSIQFYIIDGGAEGFLDDTYAGRDAGKVMEQYTEDRAWAGSTIFDDNDLLIAFSRTGSLISSALLRRPISVELPKNEHYRWTEEEANKVYKAWDNTPVSLYRNEHFNVQYFGLAMKADKGGYYKGVWEVDKDTGKKQFVKINIDLHKEEGTKGCIFIVDPDNPVHTPNFTDKTLSLFEPKFIREIQSAIKKPADSNIGTTHMLSVWGWKPNA